MQKLLIFHAPTSKTCTNKVCTNFLNEEHFLKLEKSETFIFTALFKTIDPFSPFYQNHLFSKTLFNSFVIGFFNFTIFFKFAYACNKTWWYKPKYNLNWEIVKKIAKNKICCRIESLSILQIWELEQYTIFACFESVLLLIRFLYLKQRKNPSNHQAFFILIFKAKSSLILKQPICSYFWLFLHFHTTRIIRTK